MHKFCDLNKCITNESETQLTSLCSRSLSASFASFRNFSVFENKIKAQFEIDLNAFRIRITTIEDLLVVQRQRNLQLVSLRVEGQLTSITTNDGQLKSASLC